MYDVGVDCNDFMPVSLERLTEIMNNKPKFHHELQTD
jgi:hypothetical protein